MRQGGTGKRPFLLIVALVCAGGGLLALSIDHPAANRLPAPAARLFTFTVVASHTAFQPALSLQRYSHPSGAFTLHYPADWQIDEAEDATLFNAPGDSALFIAHFAPALNSPPLEAHALQAIASVWGARDHFRIGRSAAGNSPAEWEIDFSFTDAPSPEQGTGATFGAARYVAFQTHYFAFILLTRANFNQNPRPLLQTLLREANINPAAIASISE